MLRLCFPDNSEVELQYSENAVFWRCADNINNKSYSVWNTGVDAAKAEIAGINNDKDPQRNILKINKSIMNFTNSQNGKKTV